jgi:hypothetical protein
MPVYTILAVSIVYISVLAHQALFVLQRALNAKAQRAGCKFQLNLLAVVGVL